MKLKETERRGRVLIPILCVILVLLCCGCQQSENKTSGPSEILVDEFGFNKGVGVIKVTAEEHEYLIFVCSGKYGFQVVHNEGCPCKEKEVGE